MSSPSCPALRRVGGWGARSAESSVRGSRAIARFRGGKCLARTAFAADDSSQGSVLAFRWRSGKPGEPGAPAQTQREMGVTEMTLIGFETELVTRREKEAGGDVTHVGPPRRIRAVGYVRQSFEEMGKKGTSPEGQKARIAECADAHGWHLVPTS